MWEELFPFADRKALRAARLMGLKEHPQVCGVALLSRLRQQSAVAVLAGLTGISLSHKAA